MKLPLPTNIPLHVLCAEPIDFLNLGDRKNEKFNLRLCIANVMQFHATQLWELLVQNEDDVMKWGSIGEESVTLLVRILAGHSYKLDAFPELREQLRIATNTTDTSLAIWNMRVRGGSMPDDHRRMEAVGLHYGMTVDELFVYRPALTDEQVAFLRRPLESAFPKSTRMNMWLGYTTCVTVLDLALLLPSMVDDETRVVRAFRSELEAVLGPLPLQLPVEELVRIRAEKPERSYHV